MAFLWRHFDHGIHPMQFMLMARGGRAIADLQRRRFGGLTASTAFWSGLKQVTEAADLAVAGEPLALPKIRGRVRHALGDDLESHQRRVGTYWRRASGTYRAAGEGHLEKLRLELCLLAESIDGNRFAHTLLRLSAWSQRERLRGGLGAAVLIKTMAEVIRRGAEDAFSIQLPEEDEIGFGTYFTGSKQALYGSERLLDGHRDVLEQYLRAHGLEYGLRLRWYVEGTTEQAALEEVLGRFNAVEVINLRGAVVQRGGRTVAFRESLRADTRSKTFSFVSVDGDRGETLRAIREAVSEKEVCGVVLVSRPDFEFGNFRLEELQTVLLELARQAVIPPHARRQLRAATAHARTGAEFWKAAQRVAGSPSGFGKGAAWGRLLIALAHKHPRWTDPDGSTRDRPIIQAIREGVRSVICDYGLTASHGPVVIGDLSDPSPIKQLVNAAAPEGQGPATVV